MLKVNEIFGPTIQGEGKSLGKTVAFLRLANCNLHCFKCDTDYTWRFDSKHIHSNDIVYRRQDEIHELTVDDILNQLNSIRVNRLVISGGEPLLQQKKLIPLLQILKKLGWFIEVETNGTISPQLDFIDLVDQFNCSPKLDGLFSGESVKLRIREKALTAFSAVPKTNFKFVISEPKDIEEVLRLVNTFQMKEVYLMPEGRTKDEIISKKPELEDLCKSHNFNFSSRLHIELWGSKRGV